ncbi:hypothetical protein [Mesoterricola silvestris]|uniref:Uncharacterized protein n=1 Tax=Mesoterricola silvestris TaxID=2927979 RepID=A0AA48GET7_9BACT|nr:hypothetical protein [Mesoterricola silvestris]BDU71231.1 hypothetical protein METEAL_04050 [Mesoterricola silvestris]
MRVPALILLPLLLAAQARFYGPCTQGDSLANTPIGPSGNEVSYRFRAGPGGPLRGVRPFLIWSFRKAGYHGGTGGTLRIEIQSDDGSPAHLPSGQVLASNRQTLNLVATSDQFYPLITFDRTPVLQPGTLYHAVFSNIDPRRAANFVSLNAIFSRVADTPLQPSRSDEDWAMLFRNTAHPRWELRRSPGTREGFTPILEIYYDGGRSQGVGYVEFWMGAPRPIAGPDAVGEVFTVAGTSRKVEAVDLRVRRLGGKGPLAVRLETAEGKPVAEASCLESAPAPSASCSLGGCGWVEAAFPRPPPTLEAGRTYRLVLAAHGDGRFEAFPMRKGLDKGFTAAAVFPDGHAVFKDAGGWKGWTQWGQSNREDSDLQFYFKLSSK